MPLPRIQLRYASAAGVAALVAAGTFGVVAFADTGVPDPRDAASAALTPEPEQAPTAQEDDDFFRTPAAADPQRRQEDLEQARESAERAGRDAVRSGDAQASDILEEPEPEPEPDPEPQDGAPSGGSGTPVPAGSAKETALRMVLAEGWAESEFTDCLEPLWQKESGWNHLAQNPSSGAYGIPQSLPGDKMASHGSDWQTNPATQIAWGIDYIKGRYGTPCGAWAHSQANNWY
ncbi:lytic transglycosylase domain-containing protein [Nocardiopsis sp. CC223A]|uniref:aggregation-promoting factor C-terminal-like domain-containing protein n=1 Tax=Nocardiopsis sp. CC223A TaxID=3044051 RepID=UPI002795E717|nr:lytic transglycosylase domain-containing protein [Nocardiopsis sp. CC223A]